MNLKIYKLRALNKLLFVALSLISINGMAQCTLNLFSSVDTVVCGDCVTLSAFGSMNGNIAFQEDFNSGNPVGWQFTQTITIANNTCGVPSPDGSNFMWMGDASVNPRDMTTVAFDLSIGGTICFDMRYSIQGDASPCEGPDLPDEGVAVQYSNDGGTTWNTINYWDPNGGNDPSLTSWNQYCVTIPVGAMTANTMVRWHQNDVSGAQYDHWGIDNVQITLNDPNTVITWLHDSFSYPTGSSGGDNPSQVCLRNDSTFTAEITNGTNTCSQTFTVPVKNPVVFVTAGPNASICPGDCVDLAGDAKVIVSPAKTPTYENAEVNVITGSASLPNLPCGSFSGCNCWDGSSVSIGGTCPDTPGSINASMNINIQDLNATTVTTGFITGVCIASFNITSGFGCTNTSLADIEFVLVCPSGTEVVLAAIGSLSGSTVTNMCFQLGAGSFAGATDPYTGTFAPANSWASLNGCTSNGEWKMIIRGPNYETCLPVGSIGGWSISFDDPEISYPATYVWSPTTNMTNSTSLTPNVCPPVGTTYTLSATDANNCVTVTDAVTVDLSCSCNIDSVTTVLSACDVNTGNYATTGLVYFQTPPATGTLIVADCNGVQQTFPVAGLTSPVAYSLTGQSANGGNCDVTAYFSDDVTCTATTNYTAPAPCSLSCAVDSVTTVLSACDVNTGNYATSGSVYFQTPPATGTLIVEDCNGVQQTFPVAGLTSPVAYSLTGQVANGGNCDVTAYFSDDVTCTAITNYTAPAPCSVNCVISSMPITLTNCYTTPLLGYDISGVVNFTNPPATGTLTITPCSGIPQVFNAPFGTSQAFAFTGLPQTGQNCDFVAVFSDAITCTITTSFLAPPPVTSFTYGTGFCDGVTNTFSLNGTIEFTSPPATGILTISANNGTTTYDTIINPPFVSPQAWSISGIPSDGASVTITYFFTGYNSCTSPVTILAPSDCSCAANIGSFTAGITGQGQNNYQLCYGDLFTLAANGDMIPPGEVTNPTITSLDPTAGYNPGIAYLIYSCPPTVLPQNNLWDANTGLPVDPCLIGFSGVFGDNFSDINFLGAPSWNGNFTNNTVYYVPITFYDTIAGYYSFVNTNSNCYAMGSPFAVQYLSEIVSSNPTEDCQGGTFTITINGGAPELDGSTYTASNLLPANASFVNTTALNGGTIAINGLANGDMYSFDIADNNGCPITISGGPFTAGPVANAGVIDTSCTLIYSLNAIPSNGIGTWTAPVGISFVDVNSPTTNVTAQTAGTYTLTWTEDNNGCSSSSTVGITFGTMSAPTVVVDALCFGQTGSITATAQDGIAPYSYLWNTGITNGVITGSGGAYILTITDATGCSITISETIAEPTALGISKSSTNINCNGASDGVVAVTVTGGTTPYVYNWNNSGNTATLNNLGVGNYIVTVSDANNCTITDNANLTEPTALSMIFSNSDATCNNACDGFATVVAQGGTGNLSYAWSAPIASNTAIASNLCAGIYNLTVTDGNNCTIDTSNFVISEPTALSVTAFSVSPSNCGFPDGTASIDAVTGGLSSNYSYQWDANAGSQNTAIATNLLAGTYCVSVIDPLSSLAGGCLIQYCVTVSLNPAPSMAVASAPNTCYSSCDGTATAIANDNGGSSVFTYQWDAVASSQTSATASGLCVGLYSVTATDGNGCTVVESISVSQPSVVTVSPTVNTPICNGQCGDLTAAAGGGNGAPYTYTWTGGTFANPQNGQNLTDCPTDNAFYIVTATDVAGCTAINYVALDVFPPLQGDAFGTTSICENAETTLNAVGYAGNGGPYTYVWNNGAGAVQNPTVRPTTYPNSKDYIVTISDGCSANVTDTVTISYYVTPSPTFTPDSFAGCQPYTTSIQPDALSLNNVTSCFWTMEDGTTYEGCDGITHTFTEVGGHDVTFTVFSDDNCAGSFTWPSVINVYPNPTADFVYSPNSSDMLDTYIEFEDRSEFDINTWEWTFFNTDSVNALGEDNVPDPNFTFPTSDTGNYPVHLQVTTVNGCKDDTTKWVYINGIYEIYVPNAFTPDGDGKNDYFFPKGVGLSELADEFEFLIFDRWGELIFRSNDINKQWDGTAPEKGGDGIAQDGVYIWKLYTKQSLLKPYKAHKYVGTVTLLR